MGAALRHLCKAAAGPKAVAGSSRQLIDSQAVEHHQEDKILVKELVEVVLQLE